MAVIQLLAGVMVNKIGCHAFKGLMQQNASSHCLKFVDNQPADPSKIDFALASIRNGSN
jgi:hypothetical protein